MSDTFMSEVNFNSRFLTRKFHNYPFN